ncbi:MAG: putative DNA modification/repair radical SAM protein [Defluviitaleaceae bacterium]|nr:putative DNA modification/repair radical SAM protein [Defluviitaleaceae bacterium]MCL2836063.1 putative DNA modification/repair radical SAM protein [Defluviitaleaceae bacterium]
MDILEKLRILTDAAKYDVACTSSGVNRKGVKGKLGSANACGICHTFAADGRCISLLKILMTNYCIYDCQYCVNRRSNDVPRAAFTPEEIARLTINFYRRNYIEGLFLSATVIKSPDYTMELLYQTLKYVRKVHHFNGYIHVKAIPGASQELIAATGLLADRMSVNIEMPSAESLALFAPEKTKESILLPMKQIKNGITRSKAEVVRYKHAPSFVPAGQATQLVVGASSDNDRKIVELAEGLYNTYSLKRVFYSAYVPVPTKNKMLPTSRAPLLREHRLYQADFLLRFYGFNSGEIFENSDGSLNMNMDPKCSWAMNNLDKFPVEINKADKMTLLRVPGIGTISADRIAAAQRQGPISFETLKKMGVVLKRAQYFITCGGRMYRQTKLNEDFLTMTLSENKIDERYDQLSLADDFGLSLLPAPAPNFEDELKCLTGQL